MSASAYLFTYSGVVLGVGIANGGWALLGCFAAASAGGMFGWSQIAKAERTVDTGSEGE